MSNSVELLQGTLEMLILKAVSLGPLHGYGTLLRIQQISKSALQNSARISLPCPLSSGAQGLDHQ